MIYSSKCYVMNRCLEETYYLLNLEFANRKPKAHIVLVSGWVPQVKHVSVAAAHTVPAGNCELGKRKVKVQRETEHNGADWARQHSWQSALRRFLCPSVVPSLQFMTGITFSWVGSLRFHSGIGADWWEGGRGVKEMSLKQKLPRFLSVYKSFSSSAPRSFVGSFEKRCRWYF